MSGAPGIVLSFVAGLVSFLSPCVLPIIPSYLSFIGGVSLQELQSGEQIWRRRVALRSIFFVVGFGLIFTASGLLFSGVGILLNNVGRTLSIVGGAIIILLGLNIIFDFWGLLNIEKRLHRATRPAGYFGTMVAGMAFAAGWSPCIGPILTTILFLAGQSGRAIEGAFYLMIYSLGLGLPFIAAGLFFPYFQQKITNLRRHMRAISIGSGLFLIGIGLVMIFNRFRELNRLLVAIGYRLEQWQDRSAIATRLAFFMLLLLIAGLAGSVVIRRIRLSQRPPRIAIVVSGLFLIAAALQLVGAIDIGTLASKWLQFQGI